MVRSFNLLRNVGKFDNVAAGARLPFSRLTAIYAENARGKTTLAAILRSLASGRPDLVTERARLGAPHPHIVIDTGAASLAVFQNRAWSRTAPEIVVFDDTFVVDNVCSGIEVGATQRQNLHELIVGAQGIALARALQTEVDHIEQHNKELRDRENAIPVQTRGGLSVDAFCSLAMVEDLPRTIEEAERRLAAGREADKIARMPTFPAFSLPRIDVDALRALLAGSLPDLDASALARVQEHFQRLGRGGEAWVAEGMAHFAERPSAAGHAECPFCAQDLRGSPLLGHYRAYFGDAYEGLKRSVVNAVRDFRTVQGGDVPAAFERSIREVVERQAFWKAFAEVPAVEIDTAAIARTWKAAREAVEHLFEAKQAAPLDGLSVPADIQQLIAQHNNQCDRIRELSDQLVAVNPRLDIVKEQAREANIATLTTDLAQLRAVEARHDPATAPLCEAYLTEKAAKEATEQRRREARAALDLHRQAAFPAYGVAINDFLQRFNASFRLGPVDPVNTRGGSAANYTLLIDGNPVPLSANAGDPSFRNTLSAGDRNTLALAFFFASLQNDPQRARKVVVIDDPMTSLDEHRTLHTLQEIDRLAREVAGIVVMSHSKPFLLGVWDKCQQLPKAALEVRRAGAGSTLVAWDVNAAMVTEHDRRYAAAVEYLQQADPAMERRVAESLRPMLEAFCRVAYPADFPPGTMLGPFHRECQRRAGTPKEIMSAPYAQELRAILDYANRYHHDTNPTYATELINDAELSDFARRTLAFIRRS